MSNDDNWSRYSKLVMANLEDHEDRIKVLENAIVNLKLDLNKMMMRYSFIGSVGGAFVALLPVALTWYFTK